MTDCIGITKFWDIDLIPTHQCQRWKMDMLRFDFTAIHRPEHMLFVCNLLSRYNLHASKLREAEKDKVKARDTRIEQRILGGMSINKGVRKLAATSLR